MDIEIGERRTVTTNDGVNLSYIEAGSGQPLVMVPGWSQTAAQWHHQIEAFAQTHRVIALDMRGHGESDKPGHGYRVYRLSQDLRDAMVALDVRGRRPNGPFHGLLGDLGPLRPPRA